MRSPSRITVWPVTSISTSPTARRSGPGSSLRRMRALIRATSSLGLNGFET